MSDVFKAETDLVVGAIFEKLWNHGIRNAMVLLRLGLV